MNKINQNLSRIDSNLARRAVSNVPSFKIPSSAQTETQSKLKAKNQNTKVWHICLKCKRKFKSLKNFEKHQELS